MLRLVNISGARSNAPEYELIVVKGGSLPAIGSAVDIGKDGGVIGAKGYPKYVVAGCREMADVVLLTCYEVTGNMLFLVDYEGEDKPTVGDTVGLCCKGELPDAVCKNDGGFGKIIEISDHPKQIYVRFDKEKEKNI